MKSHPASAETSSSPDPPKAPSRAYIAIDMKSFYASVECVHRHLDPLRANLLVADPSRTDQTICLAVSPALKAIGVPSRPRLFAAKQAIRRYELRRRTRVYYEIAVPRMAEYERVSALIYSVYLRYAAPEDIHVYSIDEVFIDCTPYLHFYASGAAEQSRSAGRPVHPAHVMAMTIIRDVLKTTGITATVGIGTNLYLAKIAMDIVAKKAQPDADGVRIAELNELSYCYLLWDHRPLTDFWQIGPGKARRLQARQMYTMGDIADRSQWDEQMFYREFGIDGEILIDHAWGIEPVTMQDIKSWKNSDHSLSNGQVLPRPYQYEEARIAFAEMIDLLCSDMYRKNVTCRGITWWVSYDYKSLEHCPEYDGELILDFYGRWHPKHSKGTVRLAVPGNSLQMIRGPVLEQFDKKTDHRLLFRRLGVNAVSVKKDTGIYQLDLFTDYEALEKERKIRGAMLQIRQRFGKNAVLRGINLLDGAMTRERNEQIGGHHA
ncbi:MAG: DNA methylase [Lachnospiraceae bacterium]|nr:DNA methylase [Lachnospiraceae bacterium]